MAIFTLATGNRLKPRIFHLPNTINRTLPRTLPSLVAGRLIRNIHSPSAHTTTPSLHPKGNKQPLHHPTRSFHAYQTAINIDLGPPPRESKRTPWVPFTCNDADVIERNMRNDGFRTWGLVLYRCTYASDADWTEFMSRFRHQVRSELESHDGLDLLDSFALTVVDDRRFDGATPDTVRTHFNEWAARACVTEQGVPFSRAQWSRTARYGLFIMVNEEAMRSVLDIPPEDLDGYNQTGFVILVNGRRDAERWDGEDAEPLEDDFEPLYGCTEEDVGWMRVRYGEAQVTGSARMESGFNWEREYRRPPEIGFQ
ncbi:uncharacterized protein BO97DRAFT_408310 [Aspergillus homomorphus CBS 101889]|uniref:Muramidase n=1 Tax=Aspergillus homomorphus (strain CBS 101889) TaxID=1450537 RepID=A0A395HM34_ASPHC|nr:hypothetical protein BO97DRAFT_408310 [Aspergillus homomorphus CBS 101889]RAL08483.1 hypothetical protein BO97DRAFT_408310 [Aspergillus homomorphus CBS 101889]